MQSRLFKRHQALGTPTAIVERSSNWFSDELIYLDISNESSYDLNRDDLNHSQFSTISEIIQQISKKCLSPLTFGGGIRNVEDARMRIKLGADKITVNSLLLESPETVKELVSEFGSQCIVASIDVKVNEHGKEVVYKKGKNETHWDPVDFAREVEKIGVGEILLNAVDRDGGGQGFHISLINKIAKNVRIPVIALGGAGKWEDFEEVLLKTNASAVAAANIFHHSENSVYNLKKYLYDRGLPVRKPIPLSEQQSNL